MLYTYLNPVYSSMTNLQLMIIYLQYLDHHEIAEAFVQLQCGKNQSNPMELLLVMRSRSSKVAQVWEFFQEIMMNSSMTLIYHQVEVELYPFR